MLTRRSKRRCRVQPESRNGGACWSLRSHICEGPPTGKARQLTYERDCAKCARISPRQPAPRVNVQSAKLGQGGFRQINEMQPVKIMVDSLADEGLTNAQMINGREIVSRLNPDRFFVTMFVRGTPAAAISGRPNTRLIQLPAHRQTILLLAHFLFGRQDILFYLKASPAGRAFLKLRSLRRSRCIVAGTIESQTDWQDETITPKTIRLLEDTVLRCDYLFSNSAFVQRNLETNYRLPSEVVPTGVDTDFFTPIWDRPANPRPRVLYVGALRPFKGPQVVLDAAQRYPYADFVVVGDGIMARELRERAK